MRLSLPETMPKSSRNVQFSPHGPETHTFEKSNPEDDLDRPASADVRQASSSMIDDVYAAVMIAAGADDNTLSLALCRTQTEFCAKKAQLMQVISPTDYCSLSFAGHNTQCDLTYAIPLQHAQTPPPIDHHKQPLRAFSHTLRH